VALTGTKATGPERGRQARRRTLLGWESALVLVAIMFLGSLALWVGVPLGWLWVGSRVQAGTDSIGLALAAMMVGMVLTITGLVLCLVRLGNMHVELQEVRGRGAERATALEKTMVASAAVAVVGFLVWFFGFSGSEPFPLKIGY
jgi:hypothetical protein